MKWGIQKCPQSRKFFELGYLYLHLSCYLLFFKPFFVSTQPPPSLGPQMGRIEYGYITITVGHMWIKKNVFLEIWLCFIELISTHIDPRTFPKTLERAICFLCKSLFGFTASFRWRWLRALPAAA